MSEHRLGGWLRLRFVLDRVAAAGALLALVPVVVVLAVAVRLNDGGPAFVRVERMGRGFRPFRMLKLRTMRADGPNGRAKGAPLTSAHDDRVTSVGKRMRAYHLDEIPQLWNVVRGEMLLFGPRPETPEYVDEAQRDWRFMLRVPPGIAGPTQMIVGDWERNLIEADPSGDSYRHTVLPVKLAIDRWYLETLTPRSDLRVALALAKRFIPGSRACRMRNLVREALPDATALIWDEAATPVSRNAQELEVPSRVPPAELSEPVEEVDPALDPLGVAVS